MQTINFILSSAVIIAVIIIAGSAILLITEIVTKPFRALYDIYKDFRDNESFYDQSNGTKKPRK